MDWSRATRVIGGSSGEPSVTLKSSHLSCLGLDALFLVGSTGVQLLDFCCSCVSVLVLLLNTHLDSSQC